MRKDIALAGKIDAEHRSRQNLRHSALGDDLLFLRHYTVNIRASARRSRSRYTSRKHSCPRVARTENYPRHDLAELLQRKRLQIFAKLLTFPPCAGLAKLVHRCKAIAIKHRANVTRRFMREWVVCEQAVHFMRALKQSEDERDEPRIFARRSQSGKPHLPVESRLVRRTPTRQAFHVAGFPFEFVRQPVNPISAAFKHDFAAVLRHLAKKAVTVHDPKCFELFVKIRQRARWSTQRFKCAED